MKRLEQVQSTVRLMTQDFERLGPRPVRDVVGDGAPARVDEREQWANCSCFH